MTGTPAVATVVLGGLAALAALLIQLEVLVEMMSIGNGSLHTKNKTFPTDLRIDENGRYI